MIENKLMNQIRTTLRKIWFTSVEREQVRRRIVNSSSAGGIDYAEILLEFDSVKTLPEMSHECQELEEESRNYTMGMIDNYIIQTEEDSLLHNCEISSAEITDDELNLLNRLKELTRNTEKGNIFNCKIIDQKKVKECDK